MKNDQRVKAIVLEAAAFMIDDAKRQSNFDRLITKAKEFIKENKENEILTERFWEWYNISAKTFVNFFGEDAKTGIFNLDTNAPTILSNIKVPILAILGDKDDIIMKSPEEDLLTIKTEARSCPKFDYRIIKGAPHSYFAHEQELADTILGWLNNVS
jgi:alpha-beta hydrolase superfamily lysophospholipase